MSISEQPSSLADGDSLGPVDEVDGGVPEPLEAKLKRFAEMAKTEADHLLVALFRHHVELHSRVQALEANAPVVSSSPAPVASGVEVVKETGSEGTASSGTDVLASDAAGGGSPTS